MQQPSPEQMRRQISVLQLAFLIAILQLTAFGFVLANIVDAEFESGTGWLVTGVLAAVSLLEVLVVSTIVLPSLAHQAEVTPVQAAVLGYAFANSVAVYGMVAAIMTGAGMVAVPFGLFALLAWGWVKNFLSDNYRDTLSGIGG